MTQIISALADISDRYQALFVDLWGCVHDGVTAYREAVEALDALLLRVAQALQGDVELELQVRASIDAPHAARPDEGVQQAGAEELVSLHHGDLLEERIVQEGVGIGW